jgi:hypothetical protein
MTPLAAKRILCVSEGHGEVTALPRLVSRVLYGYLRVSAPSWTVVKEAMRTSRAKLVNESVKSPNRVFLRTEFERLVKIARTQDPEPSALLIVCDADDDCPATWGSSIAATPPFAMQTSGVMAAREFESWVLWTYPDSIRKSVKASDPEKSPRDAKKALAKLIGEYSPVTGQDNAVGLIDVATVRSRSDSFDKLVRTIAAITGATLPPR